MNDSSTQLLDLLKTHGFRHGKFTLTSGKESDFYINVRAVALSSIGHRLIGECMLEVIARNMQVDSVAGVELGGCPLASAVSQMSCLPWSQSQGCVTPGIVANLPAVYVRKTKKEHGTGKLVEMPFGVGVGTTTVLLEDVVTTGGSSVAALLALREAGIEPKAIISVVDRLEGGKEAITMTGVRFYSLFTRHDFIPA